MESALLFREMREELRTERAEKARQKRKQKVFVLGDAGGDAAEGDEDGPTPSSMRGIEGVEKLREAYRRHPASFSKSIEGKMARVLDEYPGEVRSTPPPMLAVWYVTTFMPMGTQQAVGRLAYSLAHIHRALTKEEDAEAEDNHEYNYKYEY